MWRSGFSRIVLGAGITNEGVVLAHPVTYEQPNPRVDAPTLGVVSGSAALWLTNIVESLIGLTLVTGHLLRGRPLALGFALVGILSPVVRAAVPNHVRQGDIVNILTTSLVINATSSAVSGAGLLVGAEPLSDWLVSRRRPAP